MHRVYLMLEGRHADRLLSFATASLSSDPLMGKLMRIGSTMKRQCALSMRYFYLKHTVPGILKVSEVAQIAKQILRQAKGKMKICCLPQAPRVLQNISVICPPLLLPMLLGQTMHVKNLYH